MAGTSGTKGPVVVVGAGIGGLAAAVRMAHRGLDVLVLERHGAPGGKIRTLPSDAGPVDAGPTVLTMRAVFDQLFADVGESLDDHVSLVRQHVLARHFWPDGSRLDLFDDDTRNKQAIAEFAGTEAARQYANFSNRARHLFDTFHGPVMTAPAPSIPRLAAGMISAPGTAWRMAPLSTLAGLLDQAFDDPRLRQLFARYATYVGGSPYASPALLALIWRAESSGVWAVRGGMHRLARALEAIAKARGAVFQYDTHVDRIETTGGRVTGVRLASGETIGTGTILFNGDPRALTTGCLGQSVTGATSRDAIEPRSLSADVWAFSAIPSGPDLCHHNVFFRDLPAPEFDAIDRGERIPDPTLYLCAMDRGFEEPPHGAERFEIIANAPPLTVAPQDIDKEAARCRVMKMLARFGQTFDPVPGPASLTTPVEFDQLFPATAGSLYGQSPHGLMAAFRRPTARTRVPGLYLAGGGVHPGAGVPMATLSGRHAAEAILTDRTSTSTSRRTATRGGTSTRSPKTARVRSA